MMEDIDFDVPENTGKRIEYGRLPDKKKNKDFPLTVRFFANTLLEEKTLLNQINNKNGVRQDEKPNYLYTKSDIHWFKYNDKTLMIKCPRSYGEKCPLCEQMFALKDAAGQNIKTKWDVERGYAILAALPNDSTPYILRMKTTVRDLLFGKFKPVTVGALKQFEIDYEQKVGPSGEYGWFEISKAGQGIETEYYVNAVLTKIKEKGGLRTVPKAEAIHPDLLDAIRNPDKLPKLSAYIMETWDIDDLQKLVESDGSWIPEKYRPKSEEEKAKSEKAKPVKENADTLIDLLPVDDDILF